MKSFDNNAVVPEQRSVDVVIADAVYDSQTLPVSDGKLKAKVGIKPHPTRQVQKRYDQALY